VTGEEARRVASGIGYVSLPDVAEGNRLAEAVRRLTAAVVTTRRSPGDLAEAASTVEALAERLSVGAGSGRFDGLTPGPDGANPFPMATHPVLGAGNPRAPPVVVEAAGEEVVRATARYGAAHEGLPGRVHGGFVAMAFDTLLGFAAALRGHAGVTGALSLTFLRPTRLGAELVYEAWPHALDGRKLTARGRLLADGETTVEAEAVFVSVATEQLTQPPG
jgi:acyl-coenzyme A thioesterase PaaI-like protein